MITTITSEIQVCPVPEVRQDMMDRLGVSDLFYPNHRLRALADDRGIAFLDLAKPMQTAADRDKVYFHGFGDHPGTGHWNEGGHKFAGQLISDKLEQVITSTQ